MPRHESPQKKEFISQYTSEQPHTSPEENISRMQRFRRTASNDGDYRLLFEISPAPTVVFDRETLVLLTANTAAASHFKLSLQHMIGLKVNEVGDDTECLLHAAAGTKEGASAGWSVRRRDGAVVYVEAEWQDLEFAGRPARLVLLKDVTVKSQAEETLQETQRRRDEFLAVLAHELRNPLAPIRNALQVLKQPGVGSPTTERLHEMMERQVAHLSRLVEDLVIVSRLNEGKIVLRKEAVNAAVVLGRAAEAMEPHFEERRQTLAVRAPTDLRLEADLTRLEQVLLNLLHNAAKYTDPSGLVWLTADRENNEAVIRVRDTGIGIDRAMLPFIFEPLVQLERRLDHSRGGVGVGLTIVRQLVELHGGTVGAFSAGEGQGATFVIRLPCLPD